MERVQIVNPEHPHFPEHGIFTGSVVQLLGQPHALVLLDHCQHGTDSCYVAPSDIEPERSRPRRGGRK